MIEEYNLRITERQSDIIMVALDLLTRLSAGQFHNLKDISFEKDEKDINYQPSDETLRKLQSEMFPSLPSVTLCSSFVFCFLALCVCSILSNKGNNCFEVCLTSSA